MNWPNLRDFFINFITTDHMILIKTNNFLYSISQLIKSLFVRPRMPTYSEKKLQEDIRWISKLILKIYENLINMHFSSDAFVIWVQSYTEVILLGTYLGA